MGKVGDGRSLPGSEFPFAPRNSVSAAAVESEPTPPVVRRKIEVYLFSMEAK